MDTGTQGSGPLHTTTAMRRVIEEIATARHLDLSTFGNSTTVLNGAYEPLEIVVKGPSLVLVAHYCVDEQTGQRWADPAMLFFTAAGAGGWVPVRYDHDLEGEHHVATRVAHGVIVSSRPAEQDIQARFADAWAQRLSDRVTSALIYTFASCSGRAASAAAGHAASIVVTASTTSRP